MTKAEPKGGLHDTAINVQVLVLQFSGQVVRTFMPVRFVQGNISLSIFLMQEYPHSSLLSYIQCITYPNKNTLFSVTNH